MATTLTPNAKQQFLDNNGQPLVGGKLFTYVAGTTTKLATYTSSTGLSANTNPIVLNYRGEGNVWLPPNIAYKFVLAPATDTDPPSNPIWTVDQVVDSQLLTLYGGVDVGSANTYVLNFTANFTSYSDGIVIYWIPANTNTGPSTINVNGLGPVAILNQDGSALTSGQLAANQVASMMYKGTGFLLLGSGLYSNSSGSFTATVVGLVSPTTTQIYWQKNGKSVVLSIQGVSGISNSTSFRFTGVPLAIIPTRQQVYPMDGLLQDNGAPVTHGQLYVSNSGTIVLYNNGVEAGWTASGAKTFANSLFVTVSYLLT